MVRILVADDNAAVRHYLRGLLELQDAWRVCGEARTGSEALERVKENPPDMILLDFQMPDLNGLDVARQISQLFPKIPILMVTIHLSGQLAEEAQKAGIRGVCSKSDVGSLVGAVEALLRQQTYFPRASSLPSLDLPLLRAYRNPCIRWQIVPC
jgi:DNA-binding NarL/FixJ family response regulator